MTKFDVIAGEILALRKDFQEQGRRRDKILAKMDDRDKEFKAQGQRIDKMLATMEERDRESALHRKALEVLLKEVIASQNGQV